MATHLFPHYGNELCVSEAARLLHSAGRPHVDSISISLPLAAADPIALLSFVRCAPRSKVCGSFPLLSSLPLFSFPRSLVPSLMMFARVFTIAVQTLHSPHSLLGILGGGGGKELYLVG